METEQKIFHWNCIGFSSLSLTRIRRPSSHSTLKLSFVYKYNSKKFSSICLIGVMQPSFTMDKLSAKWNNHLHRIGVILRNNLVESLKWQSFSVSLSLPLTLSAFDSISLTIAHSFRGSSSLSSPSFCITLYHISPVNLNAFEKLLLHTESATFKMVFDANWISWCRRSPWSVF